MVHGRKPGGLSSVKFNSRKIEGKVTIDGLPTSKLVKMSVAEFDSETGKRKESKDVKTLDPSKPIWVVVHGMNSNEKEVKMNELTKALKNHPLMKDVQVIPR